MKHYYVAVGGSHDLHCRSKYTFLCSEQREIQGALLRNKCAKLSEELAEVLFLGPAGVSEPC